MMKDVWRIMVVAFFLAGGTVPVQAQEPPQQQAQEQAASTSQSTGVIMAPRKTQAAPDASAPVGEQPAMPDMQNEGLTGAGYLVGVNDMLEISVLEPEQIIRPVKVAPDGTVTFPYIGSVYVKGLDIPQIQKKIQDALSSGYLKYPVVLVSLQQSNSKQYMVYGEVNHPGTYPLEEYSTVLRAISMAGGFTRFGSSSRVKVMRPRLDGPGYETIKIDINRVMGGDSTEDVQLKAGDMVVVSEGVF